MSLSVIDHGGRNRGTGKDLPRATLITFPGRDPGDPIYNKMGRFYFSLTVFQQLLYLHW